MLLMFSTRGTNNRTRKRRHIYPRENDATMVMTFLSRLSDVVKFEMQ